AREGKDWKAARRAAGEHGTALHELCEKRLPNALDPVSDRAPGIEEAAWGKLQLSYAAIREWYLAHEPKLIFAEEALISEEFQFAGTPDCVWRFDHDIPVLGIKA